MNEMLSAKLYLLPSPGIIEVKAKVVWSSGESIYLLEYPAMGIEFSDLNTEKQKSIINFIEKNLSEED